MKSVLMIAYWFPPEGNAAVYRPLRFLRNLQAYGWQAGVVAGDGPFERHDPDLLRQVPKGTEVLRIHSQDVWQAFQTRRSQRLRRTATARKTDVAAVPPPAPVHDVGVRKRIRALVRRMESAWYHPDMQRPWIRPAVAAALAKCSRSRPDVLWATGPPWSGFVVARQVSERTGIPYVLDFRTSWTIVPSPFEAFRPGWAQRRDRRVLSELLQGAQAVTFFYAAEAECFWRLYKGALDPSRIHIIPNGFDGDVEPFAPPQTGKMNILYAGTLSDYCFDAFLEALARFRDRDRTRAERISVQFVGEEEPSALKQINDLRLADLVSISAPVPHAQVAILQRNAHALLMLERRPTHKGYELLAGAKLFGYLKAGRPILGVVPEGEAARILREVGVSTIAHADSPDDICRALETLFNAWSTGRLSSLVPDSSACERYSVRSQTAALVRALEGVAPVEPFVPGVLEVVPSLRAELLLAKPA